MTADPWTIIDTAGLADLDRGPRRQVASAATLERQLAAHLRGLTTTRRAAALGLALLWHDDLDGAHRWCQAHEGDADCDYVHALLHRREGDYGNAKYWFREVGDHPVFAAMATAARSLGQASLVTQDRWSPAAMVDACAAACRGDAAKRLPLQQVQAAEFRALAQHLFTR
jgi:hypothetical protein